MKKIYMALIVGTFVLGLSGVAMADPLITFSELPLGTEVSNQYAADGVIFSPGTIHTIGYLPVTSMNGAMITAPVLRPQGEKVGDYLFQGDFNLSFIVPVTHFSFLSGYWDDVGAGIIRVYGIGGTQIASLTNAGTGPETISYLGGLVTGINFDSWHDPAGADMDNLTFGVPEPGTLLLLGFGLIGLAGLRRKFKK